MPAPESRLSCASCPCPCPCTGAASGCQAPRLAAQRRGVAAAAVACRLHGAPCVLLLLLLRGLLRRRRRLLQQKRLHLWCGRERRFGALARAAARAHACARMNALRSLRDTPSSSSRLLRMARSVVELRSAACSTTRRRALSAASLMADDGSAPAPAPPAGAGAAASASAMAAGRGGRRYAQASPDLYRPRLMLTHATLHSTTNSLLAVQCFAL